MKFTITSITEEGVMAKEDNPIEKPDINEDCYSPAYYSHEFQKAALEDDLKYWKHMEANRKEYNVKKGEIYEAHTGDYYMKEPNHEMLIVEIGDTIEGDIKDNQIINIKLP